MRILWLAPYNPWPPHHGGKLRVWALVRRMAREDMHITVCYPDTPDGPVPPRTDNLTWVPHGCRERSTLVDKLRSTASRYPEAAWVSMDSDHAAWIARHVHEFDVVVLDQGGHVAPYMSVLEPVPVKVHVAHNVEHLLLNQLSGSLPRARSRLRYKLDALKYKVLERKLADWSDLVVAVSDVDAATIREFASTRVVVHGNGVDPDEFDFAEPGPARPMDVVLTGTLGYLPNLDAAKWLAADIWPRVRERLPTANFYLIGAQCPPEVRALDDPETGFHVTGFVDDVLPHLHRARVFLMPLRMGGGTRLKALQAMAAGCPVVSTALGVEGLSLADGQVSTGETAQELADATVSLLTDDERRMEQARRARQHAVELFSWESIAESFRKDLLELVGRGDVATPGRAHHDERSRS